MEDKERANMVLKIIGEMPYFDPEAIVKVLVNEFAIIRKEAAQQTGESDLASCCAKCGSAPVWACPKCDLGETTPSALP